MNVSRSAFRFFMEHSGIVGRAAECALELARAEEWARERVEFKWGHDDMFSPKDFDGAEDVQECLYLLATDTYTGVSASLGGICDPDRVFGRICEAELAHECMLQAIEIENAQVVESLRRY